MCGIWACLGPYANSKESQLELHIQALKQRGPDNQILKRLHPNLAFGFARLAINGLTEKGNQPMELEKCWSICNGEIYNYRQLAESYTIPLEEGNSDCQVLLPIFFRKNLHPTEACRALDGVFAMVLTDTESETILIARDPYGVRPLYEGRLWDGSRIWTSEIKALPKECICITPFPPGTWQQYCLKTGNLLQQERYHTVPWVKIPGLQLSYLRQALETAVEKRLMSDQPVGALLSGGLDSSLIAAIAARHMAKQGKRLHTFSIGMPGSTDLGYAKKVADHIGSIHHEILLTKQDFLNAVESVIAAIESYDITTVRASVGNWLVGKWIREHTDIKVVLNGDGSDEVGGGYLYFYKAPSDDAFEGECGKLLEEIHLYDVLRSDRCISAHGLEPRTPFLDKQVVATWLSLPTRLRRPIQGKRVEKQALREAFAESGLLPDEVLWRKKEAFSDGVSAQEYSWYKTVQTHAEKEGLGKTDATQQWTWNPPTTAEAAWYRKQFESLYGCVGATCIPHMWMPNWVSGITDPSARILNELY